MKGLKISCGNKGNSEKILHICCNLIGVIHIDSEKRNLHLLFPCIARWVLFRSIFIVTLQKTSLTCVTFACFILVGFVHPVLIVYSLWRDVILPSQFPWQFSLFLVFNGIECSWKLRGGSIPRQKAKSCASVHIFA